jgi:succinate dehydrogenase/fumarate reductase flavoprotein subunit
MKPNAAIVIVGAGHAGVRAANTLRADRSPRVPCAGETRGYDLQTEVALADGSRMMQVWKIP